MRIENGGVWLDLPADLVDEALILASQSAPDSLRKQYREERDAISSIEIVDIREESFRQLDAAWVERLRIGDPLRNLLVEKAAPNGGIQGCMVKRVRADVDEGASLDDDVLYLALRAETLLSLERLREIVSGVF
jgi:hypothetical protein